MFKFWRTDEDGKGGGTAHYEGSFSVSSVMDSYLANKLKNHVIENLTEAWVEKYGSALLDKIAPEEVEKAIRQAVAGKILK